MSSTDWSGLQWVSSLLAARLACPFGVHSGGRIAAREEANEKGLAAELLQTILDLSKKAFRDVVREDHLAIGLVGGHGGVTEKGGSGRNGGMCDWKWTL